MKTKIPPAIIGLLSNILPDHYSNADLDGLFLTASAPENIPDGGKSAKVLTWLRLTNKQCAEPLEVLGSLLASFMDSEPLVGGDEHDNQRREACNKITEVLAKDGLRYLRGGYITKGGSVPTLSLQANVAKRGLAAVEIEIQRSLSNVESDPLAAIHSACSVLEASLKAYLTHHNVAYKEESDTLSDLWNKVVSHVGIHPKELDKKDLKKIASGLFSIVDGTMHLRNKKSAAHGKSEEQLRQNTIRPRHARLAINSAHTVSAYVLELMDDA